MRVLARIGIVLVLVGGAALRFHGVFRSSESAVHANTPAPVHLAVETHVPGATPTAARADLERWVSDWLRDDAFAHARSDTALLGKLETGSLLDLSRTEVAADLFRTGGAPVQGAVPDAVQIVAALPPRAADRPFLAQVTTPAIGTGAPTIGFYVFTPGADGRYQAAFSTTDATLGAPLPAVAAAPRPRRHGALPAHRQLAAWFGRALRDGTIVKHRFRPGLASTGVAAGFARSGPLSIAPKTHVRRVVEIGRGRTIAAFALQGGRRLECGTVEMRIVYTRPHGAVVQDAARVTYGPAVVPGKYRAVKVRTLFSTCIALPKKAGVPATVFGTDAGLAAVSVTPAR